MEKPKPSTWHEYSCEICGSRFESADKLSREERLCSANCECEYYRGLDDAAYEAAREDRIAIEILPRQSDVVDSANMYWFFLCPKSHEAIIDKITCNQGAGL